MREREGEIDEKVLRGMGSAGAGGAHGGASASAARAATTAASATAASLRPLSHHASAIRPLFPPSQSNYYRHLSDVPLPTRVIKSPPHSEICLNREDN